MRFLTRMKTKIFWQEIINKSLIPTFGLLYSHYYHTFAKSSDKTLAIAFQNLQSSLVSKISFFVSLLFGALVDTSIPTYYLNFSIFACQLFIWQIY